MGRVLLLFVLSLGAGPARKLSSDERAFVSAAQKLKPDDGPNAVTEKTSALGKPKDRLRDLDDGSTARTMSWTAGSEDELVVLFAGFYRCRREFGPSWCLLAARVDRCRGNGKCMTLYKMPFR